MTDVNVFNAEFEYDESDPAGYNAAVAEVGRHAGGKELSVRLFELPPGQSLCPYHYEYVEEWLLVLVGAVSVRLPDGDRQLDRGELVCFAKGPGGAHKVSSSGDQTAHVLMFSSAAEPAVSVYPDSDKIAVWPGNEADNVMLKRADGQVGYWVDEP